MNKMKAEVFNIKTSLEKLKSEESVDTDSILDLLTALSKLHIPADLIKQAKLGPLVSGIKAKCEASAPDVVAKAKVLLVTWKQTLLNDKNAASAGAEAAKTDVTSSMPAAAAAAAADKDKEKPGAKRASLSPKRAVKASNNSSSSSGQGGAETKVSLGTFDKEALSQPRKAVVNIFASSIKAHTGDQSEVVALALESALYALHPIESAQAQYTTKAKSLSFNLKQNSAISQSILTGVLSPDALMQMSTADMSSQELKKMRIKDCEEDYDGRRNDWLAAHREEIQRDNGLDPENVWEYENDDDSGNEEEALDV